MRKITFLLTMLVVAIASLSAQLTVQGVPYKTKDGQAVASKAPAMLAAPMSSFTFDDIKFWAGEGSNRAAMVVQWNCDGETTATVFGFRWNGTASGADMCYAIAKEHPRFYWLTESGTAYGSTIAGMGWDADNDGDISLVYKETKYAETEPGTFEAKGYSYDDWTASDPDDYWQAGWYKGYWSYYIADSNPAAFGYSGVGASGRQLTDGCWDGWNYNVNMMSQAWKEFEAAPALTPAGAHTQFCVDGIYYTLADYSKRTVAVSAPMELDGVKAKDYAGAITVPATITANDTIYNVTAVADTAFVGAEITTVTLPTSVTKIGKRAFMGSTLTAINVTDVVTSIGDYAFYGCVNLTTVHFPASISTVGEGVYGSTGLTSLVIPDHITSIGASAFESCASLATVTLGTNLVTIGASAFEGCAALASIDIPDAVKTVSDKAFAGCDGLTAVTIKRTVPLVITDATFSTAAYANATLTVPMGYTAAYAAATGWKNFTNTAEVAIAVAEGDIFSTNGVAYTVATNSDTDKTVKVVHYPTEGGTSGSYVTIANKAGYVGEITIPSTVKYQNEDFKVAAIADSAFYGANALTKVTVDESLADKLGTYVFYGCSTLETVTLPTAMTSIPARTFYNCSKLATVNVPATVTSIGDYAFYSCAVLPTFDLPAGLMTVGQYAFAYCKGFTSVTLPSGVTQLPNNLFAYCSALTDVTISGDVATIGNSVFSDCTVLKAVTFPASVTSMGTSVLKNCKALTAVEFPETLTTIPANVCQGCIALTTVKMSDNVTALGSSAFSGCTVLADFTMPSKVATLGSNTFQNCTKLKIDLPETVTTLGTYAFSGCTAMDTVTLGSKLKAIPNYCFAQTGLKNVTVPENVTTIGSYAFQKCASLTSVTLHGKITSMGSYAFGTTAMTSVVIPASVTSVSSNLINGATALEMVYACKTTPQTAYSSSFLTKTGTYAPITVPYGSKSKYATTNYWKSSAISEVVPAMNLSTVTTVTPADNTATLVVAPEFDYGTAAVPALFATANNAAYFAAESSAMTVKLQYRKAGRTDYQSVTASADNATTEYDAILSSLIAGTEYEYRWVTDDGTTATTGEWKTFKTTGTALIDYTTGVFLLNEDWFGHNNSTINYLTASGEWIYRAFRQENAGSELGCTSQFGTIYGDKMYLLSKQAQDGGSSVQGSRLAICDATTLKLTNAMAEYPNGADSRSFLGVDERTGYVGTSNGIVILDLSSGSVLGAIDGTGSEDGSLYSDQIGTMARVGNRVFAVHQKKGLLVINATNNMLESTIEGYYGSVVVAKDGSLWLSVCADATSGNALDKLARVDPYTLETTEVALPTGFGVPNSWYAWTADAFCSSTQKNRIYWKETVSGWFGKSQRVNYYDIDEGRAGVAVDFSSVDDGAWGIYGAGVRVDPVTDDIYCSVYKEYASQDYEVMRFDNGEDVTTAKNVYPLEQNFWFPAMFIFPDNYAPVVSSDLESIVLKEQNKAVTFKLLNYVTDYDNQDAAISYSVSDVSNPADFSAEIVGGNLVVTPKSLTEAMGTFTLNCLSNGKAVSKVITIDNLTGIGGLAGATATVSVYPNPATDALNITGQGVATLYSLTGTTLMTTAVDGNAVMNVSSLDAATYILRVKGVNGINTIKVIKK